MAAAVIYLADTSVLVQQRQNVQVRERFERLLVQGRLAICQMSALEFLNNAPDPRGYETIWAALRVYRWLDVTVDAMDRALDTHRRFAEKSQHRGFSLPELIIAATAEQHGATVLHYDDDYDRIAAITGQPVEWVAPRGSL
jgi:predicted nucleic acid-binding protein